MKNRKKHKVLLTIVIIAILIAVAAAIFCRYAIKKAAWSDDHSGGSEDSYINKIAEILPWEYRSTGFYRKPVLRWASDDSLSEKEKMQALSWYDPKREERYDEYRKNYPNMDYKEVVWRVDMDIDKAPYIESSTLSVEAANEPQAVVNKMFKLPGNYEPELLYPVADGYWGTPETALAFRTMKKAAADDNVKLTICSCYRSLLNQFSVYKRYIINKGITAAYKYAARPGYSEHHTGRAIDMDSEDGREEYKDTKSYAWLRENAYKYGFIFRYNEDNQDVTGYSAESWHITYIGRTAANTMHVLNLKSLEEYKVKFVDYRPCRFYNFSPWCWLNSVEELYFRN